MGGQSKTNRWKSTSTSYRLLILISVLSKLFSSDSIVDAYIASIAIRIMSDTRGEEQEQGERDKIEVCCKAPKI